jgi:protein-histidine pros-kinase
MDPKGNKLTELTFHLIVDSAPSAVVLVNELGLIGYANREFEKVFGYLAPELIGKPVEVLIPERFRTDHVGLRSTYLQGPALRRMGAGRELFALRKDGSEFPVEIGLNPMVLVDGVWVLVTILDITERKMAESRFRQVVDSAPNAMVLVNKAGLITLVNQRALTLFGYTQDEMLGRNMDMLLPLPLQASHAAMRDRFFASPQARYMGAGRDLSARCKDGTEIPVEVGLNPIETETGMLALASIIDISARRQAEELRRKKEAAEAAYKAKGELLAIASHDLKNPLVAIAGLAEIMLEMKQDNSPESQQDAEFLRGIREAAEHMSEVIKGILASEGIEQQGIPFDKKPVDLSKMCIELTRLYEVPAQNKNIALVSEITSGIEVGGNKTRLREAFENYVSNAIKYSPPGRSVTVTLAKTADGQQVEFGVHDQGPGLTDDDKAKLFGKFKRLSAKPTGGESSTGLGLSIVKTIIELHKGQVGCDSQVGEGAYFWARLPLQ